MVAADAVAWARDRFPGLRAVNPAQAAHLSTALAARLAGDFGRAGAAYLLAGGEATDGSDELHHRLRAAGAMILADRLDEAGDVVDEAIASARSMADVEALATALGMHAVVNMRTEEAPAGFAALAEALHLVDQLDDSPMRAVVFDTTGHALTLGGLVEEGQDYHRRAADLAPTPDVRCWSLAQLATCRTAMAATATDGRIRAGHVASGIETATEVIDRNGGGDRHAVALSRANRAVLHALGTSHGEAAIDAAAVLDSDEVVATAPIEAIALTGGVLARWAADRDASVVDDCQRIMAIAPPRGLDHCIDLVVGVHVDALGAAGRHDDIRVVLDQHLTRLRRMRERSRDLQRAYLRLGLAHNRAEARSELDPLTGLHNRRFLDRFVGDLVDATTAGAEMGCVAVIDLDGFKPVNDEHGYAAGDRVLRELAIELQRQCRRADGVARLGGDEFVVVLPGTSPDTARRVLDRIRTAIATRRWGGLPSRLQITTSIGFTMVAPGAQPGALIDEASQAMQHAKRSGRDQIAAWSDIEHRTPDRRMG